MNFARTALAVIFVVFVGCSSGEEVRSDGGPSAQAGSSTAESGDASASTAALAASPTTSEFVRLQGVVNVPEGEPGKLSVVVVGPGGKSSVPVIIRNRTSDTLSNIEVTGTARSGDGKLIGSGSSQGFVPSNVKSGEWAFGYVFIDAGDLPVDATFDFTATGDKGEESGLFGAVDVKVAEVEITKAQFGGNQVVGVLQNPTSEEVAGPVSVDVMCFDGDRPVSTHRSYAEGDSVPPNGTTSFSVDLFEASCGTFAIGASGHAN